MLEKLTCSYVTDCGRADVLEKLGVVIDLESEVRNWYLKSSLLYCALLPCCLVAPDQVCFDLCRGENVELCVGVHRAMETQQNDILHMLYLLLLGVLATASHVISTGTM